MGAYQRQALGEVLLGVTSRTRAPVAEASRNNTA